MQDKKGYIWFSTDAGLCRYNGNSVKVYNSKKGLPEGATYNVFQDKKGVIWMTTSTNRVMYYQEDSDSLIEAPLSNTLAEIFKSKLKEIYFARITGNGNLWLCSNYITTKVSADSKVTIEKNYKDTLAFIIDGTDLIPIRHMASLEVQSKIDKDKQYSIVIIKNKKKVFIPILHNKKHDYNTRILTVSGKKGEYFIGFNHVLIKLNNDLTWEIHETNFPILDLYIDNDNGLWVCQYKGGVVYYPNPFNNEDKITSLDNLSVTDIFEDSERGIWCTTLDKGVFYCRNKHILNYANIPGLDKKVEFLRAIRNTLYTSSEKSDLFEIRNGIITKHPIDMSIGLTDIVRDDNTFIVSSKAEIIKTDTAFVKIYSIMNSRKKNTGANLLSVISKEKILAMCHSSILELKGNALEELQPLFPSPSKWMLVSGNEGILIGCVNGLYKLDTILSRYEKIPGTENTISHILETRNKDIWVTTKNGKLYMLKKGMLQYMNDSLGLITEKLSDITEDRNGTLWLASNIGLIKVKKPYSRANISIYNSQHGLSSDEVLKINIMDETIFASTYEGLCSFPLNANLNTPVSHTIYLDEIRVNEKATDLKSEHVFNYNENNIHLIYDIPIYKLSGAKEELCYKINGLDDKMHYVSGNKILLDNLPPGTYTVNAYILNDGKLGVPATVQFSVKKPFWQTSFFIGVMALLFLIVVFSIVALVIRQVKKQEEEKTRVNKLLAEYQMSALRAQMNPHFIFNCINSIQRYILTKKPDTASKYLSKFSKLIRFVLDHAEENLITVAEEIEIVELYIELEQLRFENRFSYEIKIEKNVHVQELKLPAMILQPYIENAIWHGLMNLKDDIKGYISISLSLNEDVLRIIIQDNGVGLKQAAALSNKNHKSKSNQINNRRTEILNSINQRAKGKIIIEDISDINKTLNGTKVTIDIPQNSNEYE